MTEPPAKLTAVTLGVRDLPASARFYEALGFIRKFRATGDEIVFLDGGAVSHCPRNSRTNLFTFDSGCAPRV